MIICCPKCAETLEVPPDWIGRRGTCPICQSSIIFSDGNERVKAAASQPLPEFDPWKLVGIGIAILGLLCMLLFFWGASCFNARASAYNSDSYSGGYRRSGSSDHFDPEKERARAYIDSLPEGQRAAFYRGGGDSTDYRNLLTNLLESDNLDGAISLLESQ